MVRRGIATVALIFGLSIIFQPVPPSSQVQATQSADKNERGRKLYIQHCASCHGEDGKGNGPVSPSLKTAAPDLTTIAKREGKFDRNKIQLYISGEIRITAHGTEDMPVWGYVFRQNAGGQSASSLAIYALTNHIESIQKK